MNSWRVLKLAIMGSRLAATGCLLILLSMAHSQSSLAQVTSDSTLSVSQLIHQVLKNNNRIAAAEYMAESAERRVGPAGAWSDPMLMLGIQNSPTNLDLDEEDMTMKMIGLSQEIPYAGYRGRASKAAKAEAGAAQAGVGITVVDLVTAAKNAYIDLYLSQQNLKELQGQHELLQEIVDATLSRIRANRAGQEEALSAQANLWRLESSILSTEQQVVDARQTLNSLRGASSADTMFTLAAPELSHIPEATSEWVASAEKNYPEFQKLRFQSQSYGASASSMRRMRWPMLELNGSYGIRTGYTTSPHGELMKRDDMISFGATISLPIFEGRSQGQSAKSMDAMRLSVESEGEQLRREVAAKLASMHSRAIRLRESLGIYRDRIVPTSMDAYTTALNGYTNERVNFTELLNLAGAVYADRMTANQLEAELLRTLADAERYTVGVDGLVAIRHNQEK